MSALSDAVRACAQGRMPAGRVAFLWTIHEGMRGTTELEVSGDGRVLETRSLPSATVQDLPAKEIGRVSPEDVRALAEAIDRSRFEEIRASAPASPDMTMITLDVQAVGLGARAEFPASDAGRPGITEVREAFLRLRKRAETQPYAPPSATAAPAPITATPPRTIAAGTASPVGMEVRLTGFYKLTMGCGGLMSFGVVPLAMWFASRRFPRSLDAEGATLRNGQRLLWAELTPVKLVARGGAVLGWQFETQDGRHAKFPYASLADSGDVCQFALDRIAAARLQLKG